MTGVEKRPGNDPDRVREVDDPRAGRCELARPLGDLEDDRHRPQRLGEAAGPGRLLADAAARERQRLVLEARRLAADADLDEDEVGAVQRTVEVAGQLEAAGEALPLEHPPGEAADDLEPLRVDVVQRESTSSSIACRPDTSSGVYVDPAPITATRVIPSPPSA